MRLFILSFFFLALLTGGIFSDPPFANADAASDLQSEINANNQQLDALQAKIDGYQKQLNSIGVEKNTLQSTINTLTLTQKKLTTQTQVTQNKISSANLQIQKLSQSIGDKETNIVDNQNVIAKELRSIAEGDQVSFVTQIISSNSLQEVWQVADQALQFNKALTNNIHDLQTLRTTLTANRDIVTKTKASLVSLQKQLSAQNKSIAASKATEQQLLVQTKNSETTYQKLLAAAKAELASYSAFTTNAGGSKLLANQTSCDSWGCYYSQRDTLWGNVPLSGANSRLASEGCLVTTMAMILTHYGHRDVTPVTVNANPGNFSPFGGLLLFTINVDGTTATRYKIAAIDATLATGNPVVIGIHAYGGTHYVVFTSGSKGQYLMRDPYIANGKDISFTAHYPLSAIFGISKVVVSN
jgi:peptidoglycan hydrolase CwlO-like protein